MTGWFLPFSFQSCACDASDESHQLARDGFAHGVGVNVGMETALELRVPYSPKQQGVSSYSSAPDQPLLGVPIREGSLWHLSAQDRFEPVSYSLYVNGFAFSTSDGMEASVSLSPFSLVRNCRFQSGACAKLKSFKVSLQDPDPCCYFAVRSSLDREAEEERSEWVLGISHTILLITDSLLPSFCVSCDPIPGVPSTARRLLAGYLLYRDESNVISLFFCELNAHVEASAKMVMYESEYCEDVVMDLTISDNSVCCDIVGISCSCFVIDNHYFACQSPSERKLWLRALQNLKVKMQNRAPDPSAEELRHYRMSIREHIEALEATMEPRIVKEPLLAKATRRLKPSEGNLSDDQSSVGLNLSL